MNRDSDGLPEHCYDQWKGTGFEIQEWSCQEGALAGSSCMCLCKIMARPAITGKCGQLKRWIFFLSEQLFKRLSLIQDATEVNLKKADFFLKHCMIWASRGSSLCPWKDIGMAATWDFGFLLPNKAWVAHVNVHSFFWESSLCTSTSGICQKFSVSSSFSIKITSGYWDWQSLKLLGDSSISLWSFSSSSCLYHRCLTLQIPS